MAKDLTKIIVLSCLLLVFSVCIMAQTKARPKTSNSITGVYAGFSLPLIGVNGDMQTYMRTFYFRENGTFVTELDEPDWQTRVDGNYRIVGNKLIIQSNLAGDSPSEIEIKENGGLLFYNGASLMKLNAVSSIPAVIVNNNSGASSGGIGTNNVFVAVSSSDLYNFDGRRTFSHNSSSASVISGAGVGGGKSRDNSGGGTYTIKDGLLTLNYSNGKIVRKSFFYSETDGDGTALIDGSFHFETEESKKTQLNVIAKRNSDSAISKSNSTVTTLNGAYAGSKTDIFTTGVSTFTYTYYFRPDGTYTTELDKPDWQTRVDGTYSLKGKKVTLVDNERGQTKEFELNENGSLDGYPTLIKYNVANAVPARHFETTSANTTGGLGSGVRAFGTISESSLIFDGNGRFSHSNSFLKVRPDSEKTNSRGGGTYTIRNSLLTLNYDDGTINKLSFFYFEENGEAFALIGGILFWESEKNKISKTNVIQKETRKDTAKTDRTQNTLQKSLNGTYAGTSTPNLNPFNNMSISFDTYSFYFRQNGTYTNKLGESDWQTRIDGTYRIVGNKVFIQSKSGGDKPEELEIKDNGSLYYRNSNLFKLEITNNIPAVVVENKSASGGGGQIEGTVYVGNFSNTIYNFDGKGNFSNGRESSTVISGASVGGGVSGESGGNGTYTLTNGLLTLNYRDGTVVKKSFFYTEDDEGDGTALINGVYYFEPDEAKGNTTDSTQKKETTPIKSPVKTGVITSLNGAYAGSSVPVFFPGGGSSSSSYRYYFRPNGTYTTELDKPNWQTRIDGNYKIRNGKVTLIPNKTGEKPFEMDIEEEGASLVYGGNTLFKLNVMNNIPAVVVENSGGSSSGGIGTNLVFVGVSFSGVYNFDGKGRFSNNASSSSVISGANVGGGSSNESGGAGTYTIKDSLLTLTYNNGTVVKRSFFYVEFSHGGTALIDGSLYYEPDKPEKAQNNETPIAKENPPIESAEKREDLIINSSRMLKLANLAHGGDKLDSLKTIRLTGKALGFEITILVDATNQKVRNEFRKNGKLVLVEQLDGENSWQWGDNLKSPLTNEKRKELRKSLTTGLFAMQTNSIKSDAFQTADLNLKGNLKSLLVLVDGEKYGMIFDDKNRLVAELSIEDGVLQTTYSEDYRNVSGIMIPFKSKVTLGEKSIEVKFSAVEVNRNFNEKDWSVPN
jgi:hypothetical protein